MYLCCSLQCSLFAWIVIRGNSGNQQILPYWWCRTQALEDKRRTWCWVEEYKWTVNERHHLWNASRWCPTREGLQPMIAQVISPPVCWRRGYARLAQVSLAHRLISLAQDLCLALSKSLSFALSLSCLFPSWFLSWHCARSVALQWYWYNRLILSSDFPY